MHVVNSTNLDETNLFRERLRIALKAAKICVFEVDLIRQLYTFFENSEDIFGVSGDTILSDVRPFSLLPPREYQAAVSEYFSHPDDEAVISEAFSQIFSGRSTTYEARMRAGGSNFIWCKIDVTPILEDGRPVKMIGVITDISHIKRQNDLLREEARLDHFTKLYNKDCAIAFMKDSLACGENRPQALMLLDIDRFKQYNDTYGHYEGDKMIKALADLIRDTFRFHDICGRFGGDEFIILVKDFPNTEWLREKIKPVLWFPKGESLLTTSAGIAVYPQDGVDFEELFQKADKALYHSKIKRNALTFFSELEVRG